MATATEEEVTLICIDNSVRMFDNPIYKHQLKAIQFYCETKLKCNPKNLVGIFTMALSEYRILLSPTSDLQKILRTLKDIMCWGDLGFQSALENACFRFPDSPPNMKKRLLMFVGGPLCLLVRKTTICGELLKESGVAVDVVNFYVGYVLRSRHWYTRKDLDVLITTVNHNDNSHIIDVVDASSVCDILSDSILKEDLLYLQKKAQENVNVVVKQELEPSRNEKKIKAAADYHKCLLLNLERFYSEKNTSLAEAQENVNVVQQELEPSRNEKNKAVAHHKYVEPLGIQFAELKIEPFHNEKNTSSADAHAPGIKQYPTKKTARKKKTKREC